MRKFCLLSLLFAISFQENIQETWHWPHTADIRGIQLQNSAGSMATVAFSATPVFDGNQGRSFKITLTGNVTSSTFVNAIPGQVYHFMVCQDGAGLHSFIWPANFLGVISIGVTSVASKCSVQSVVFDGTNGYAPATGMLNL
jgi:hypothetical protein